ncbi:hypothetical protein CDAR_410061 [Caerostris darwini]|uniref:Uncharacterized protein n=1 Tax=Caerostris darwini TaxID=1538125 RepID=A0AAV4VWQ3_9ARAC|nr:hypothetical protein CDAR_410061 [Caerostris darwini]
MIKVKLQKIQLWKIETLLKTFALYIPPNSSPNLTSLEVSSKTIFVGKMNVHLRMWRYIHPNVTGLEFEDLQNFSFLELIFKSDYPPTYMHYNGSGSSQTYYAYHLTPGLLDSPASYSHERTPEMYQEHSL